MWAVNPGLMHGVPIVRVIPIARRGYKMRKLLGGLVALGVTAVLIGTLGASVSAADCVTNWGSLPKGALADSTQGPLDSLRTGRHDCYDRLVLNVAGTGFGYRAEYVDHVVQDGSGAPVPLRGGAKVRIIVQANAAIGFPASAPELADVSGYATFRQVAGA